MAGKYQALVTFNDKDDKFCPVPGAVRVVCPELFGMVPPPKKLVFEDSIQYMIESSWIVPMLTSPGDAIIPELGSWVYIEELGGRGLDSMVWTGFVAGKSRVNIFDTTDDTKRPKAGYAIAENTDTIIGVLLS